MKFRNFILILFLFSCAQRAREFYIQRGKIFESINFIIKPFQVTSDFSRDFYPAVSIKNNYVIYVSDRTGNLDLWLYDLETRQNYRLTYHTSDDTMPSFSPDGKKVVFVSFRSDSSGDIFIFDFKNLKERLKSNLSEDEVKEFLKDDKAKILVHSPFSETEPKFTFNSKSIVFVREDRNGIKNIYIKKVKFKAREERLTEFGATSPAISPNGKLLAYIDLSTNNYKRGHLFILNLENLKSFQIVSNNSIEFTPSFIDNEKIVYVSIKADSNKDKKIDINDNSAIYIYDLKIKKEKQITAENTHYFNPIFLKQLNAIIYSSYFKNNIDLFMLPIYGEILDLKDEEKQFEIQNFTENNYLKILANKRFIYNFPDSEKSSEAKLNIAKLYSKIGLNEIGLNYLIEITNSGKVKDDIRLQAKIEEIIISKTNKEEIIKELSELKNYETNKVFIINFYIAEIYKRMKNFNEAINYYNKVLLDKRVDDYFYLNSKKNLIEIYETLGQASKIIEETKNTKVTNFNTKINFIENALNKYFSFAIKLNSDDYRKIIEILKFDKDYKNYIEIKFVDFLLKNEKISEAETILNKILEDKDSNNYFKFLSLKYLAIIHKDRKKELLKKALDIKLPEEYNNERENVKKNLISILLMEAKDYVNNKNFLKALDIYKKILEIDENNTEGLAGKVLCEFKLTPNDIKNYEKLIKNYEKEKDLNIYSGRYHYILGYLYSLLYNNYYSKPKENKKILKKYFKLAEEELKIAYRIEPNFIEAYLTLGWLYQMNSSIDKNNYDKYLNDAITLYKLALYYNDENEDPCKESLLFLNLGNIYFQLQSFTLASECYENKLKYSTNFQTLLQEAFFYYNYGYASYITENDEKAIENFLKAYTNFIKLGEKYYAFESIVYTAISYKLKGDFKYSIEYYQKAIEFIKKNKISINPERFYRELGLCYKEMNQIEEAIKFLKEALNIVPKDKKLSFWKRPGIRIKLFDTITIPIFPMNISLGASFAYMGFNNRDEQKLLYSILGEIYFDFLDYKKSLEYLLKKRILLEEDKNYDALAALYNKLGILYFNLNEKENSLNYFELSKKYCKKIKDEIGTIINNLNIIEILIAEGELKKAEKFLDESIKIAKENNAENLLIDIYSLYGFLNLKKAEKKIYKSNDILENFKLIREEVKPYYESLKYFNNALNIALKKKLYIEIERLKFNIASLYLGTGDYEKGIELLKECLDGAKKYYLKEIEWKCEYLLAKTKNNNLNENILDIIESYPKAYNYKINEDNMIKNLYYDLIEKFISEKNYYKAIETIERYKNFKFKQIFNSYPIELKNFESDLYYSFKEKEQKILDRIEKFHKNPVEYKKFIEELNILYKEREKISNKMRDKLKYYVYKNPVSIDNIQKIIPANEVIVYFFQNNNYINSFIIASNCFKYFRTNYSKIELENGIKDLTKAIEKKDDDWTNYANKLKNILFSNFEKDLEGYDYITIIPSGIILKIPFNLILTNKNIFEEISLANYYFQKNEKKEVNQNLSIFNKKDNINEVTNKDLAIINIPFETPVDNVIKFNIDINKFTASKKFPYFVAIENVKEITEEKIIPLIINLNYCGANNITIPLWNLKEKENNIFWNNFLNSTQKNFLNKYKESLNNTFENEKYYYQNKIIFGNDFKIVKKELKEKVDYTEYLKIGDFNFTSSNYNKALENYLKAEEFITNINLKTLVIEKIILTLIKLEEFKDSLLWIEKGVKIDPSHFNKIKSFVKFKMGEYEEALSIITNLKIENSEEALFKIEVIIKSGLNNERKIQILKETILENKFNFSVSNVNPFMTEFTNRNLKIIFNKIIDNLIENKNFDYIYDFLNLFKNIKYSNKISNFSVEKYLKDNDLFCDLYLTDNYLISFYITKSNREFKIEKSKKVKKLLNDLKESVNKLDRDDYIKVLKDFNDLFFNNLEISFTNIYIFPESKLYKIPFYALFDGKNYLIERKNLTVLKSYNRIAKGEFLLNNKNIIGIGYQKNESGKVIEDFSYKEIEEIGYNFDNAELFINSFDLNEINNFNICHFSVNKNDGLFSILSNFKSETERVDLIVLSKLDLINNDDFEIDEILKISKVFAINLYRPDDLSSAIFIKIFYRNLKEISNISLAYLKSLKEILNSGEEKFLWSGFSILE